MGGGSEDARVRNSGSGVPPPLAPARQLGAHSTPRARPEFAEWRMAGRWTRNAADISNRSSRPLARREYRDSAYLVSDVRLTRGQWLSCACPQSLGRDDSTGDGQVARGRPNRLADGAHFHGQFRSFAHGSPRGHGAGGGRRHDLGGRGSGLAGAWVGIPALGACRRLWTTALRRGNGCPVVGGPG